MKKKSHYQCLVPFHLADPGGILFFGHAFTLFHQAFEHFILNDLGYSWDFWFQNPEWIVPIRHSEADYLAPVFAGQNCQIELFLSSLSQSSFTLNSFIQQSKRCCSIKTTHVFCSRLTKQKISIPSTLLSQLQNQLITPLKAN